MSLAEKKIIAVLGPTNTGKTHFAIERMLQFGSGIIGFPLRLLAREVYEKCIQKVGIEKVALITGEEKIIPPYADYFLCTVESMPLDINAEFIAIDEIQMCADPERGHIFTDRLLNMRGDKLTMFLGSNIMQNIIQKFVPEVEFIFKDRFSKLSYSGHKKISRLPGRTAIIAFSVDEVYALAEFVRRQRGGAAIVMGSLSPKTRNAQVELYQSGDVDFLVATDAIGMGINMDIDHISFNNLNKFDGRRNRHLRLTEIGQIAGRAGRYMNDGTFGITGKCDELSPEQIDKLENHKFDSVINIYWRNSNLDFTNIENLLNSLDQKPYDHSLLRNKDLLDENVLKTLIVKNNQITTDYKNNNLSTLWECCQIPDFTKSSYNEHIDIVKKVFEFLVSDKGKIPNEWMRAQLSGLDNESGNIDTLANRISHVRTWAYVSYKKNWVENSDYWISKTKDIEDKLSAKLHEELSKSFIDRRISILSKHLKQDAKLETKISEKDEVIIDKQFIGTIKGLKLNLDFSSTALQTDIKSIKKAARQGVVEELKKRINNIIQEDIKNAALELKEDFKIFWKDNPIATIIPGKDYLNPKIKLLIDDSLDVDEQSELKNYLEKWIDKEKNLHLNDLIKTSKVNLENSYARALCFRLFENHGVLKRLDAEDLLKNLDKDQRANIKKIGIKIGRYHVYQPLMIKPKAVNLKIIFWNCFNNKIQREKCPTFGLNFLKNFETKNKEFLLICGFESFENYIVRVDILEKLFLKILNSTNNNQFSISSEMLNLLGCGKEDFEKLLKLMNYKKIDKNKDIFSYDFKNKDKKKIKKDNIKKNINNPFASLKNLSLNN
ncbi:MAG: helicase [Candidatus Fonsibacter lacus]|uniref:Helicase n=1 Tax=Candidatus Fonsibacter lacus TaxID=2576439 RepID=A0A966HUG2_9PROT|nr:helicase [Candidatus Fonsibacter lacus]NCU73864.1 helicase [Candidatus Fonsibacter lacus]